jgi:hypothetical protein
MHSLQKAVHWGGAMKNKMYVCYWCNIHKLDLVNCVLVASDWAVQGPDIA